MLLKCFLARQHMYTSICIERYFQNCSIQDSGYSLIRVTSNTEMTTNLTRICKSECIYPNYRRNLDIVLLDLQILKMI